MTDDLLAVQLERHRALDPLLRVSSGPSGPDVVPLAAELPDGGRVRGLLRRIVYEEGSPITLWSTMVCWELYPLVGADPGAGMTALLGAWRRHMATVDPPADDETSYRVRWPSRDTVASAPLLHTGFQPISVFAVRVGVGSEPLSGDVAVRRATTDDLDTAVRIAMAEMTYSVTVGNTYLRPRADDIRRQSLVRRIDADEPVLLAERDGVPVGLADCVVVESDPAAEWPPVPAGRWGYVAMLSVLPSERGGGVGRALMAAAHGEFARRGAIGACLYYNPPNPLSSVFWPRQGYRPLWTNWEAHPAWALAPYARSLGGC